MLYVSAIVIAIILVVFGAWQIRQLIVGYRAATGTPWQRFLAVFSHSATILTARIGAAVTAVVGFIVSFLPAIDPASSLGTSLAGLLKPAYVPWYGLAFALLVEVVRRRPGSVDPILPPPQAK